MAPFNNNNIKVKSAIKRTRRSVQFSPQVSLRVVSKNSSESSCSNYSSWHSSDDIKMMRNRAKSLAKLHYRIQNDTKKSALAIISDGESDSSCSSATQMTAQQATEPTSYEIKGESLRGMEFLTDITTGRKRQLLRKRAISTAVKEQAYQCVSSSQCAIISQDALSYSRRVQKRMQKLPLPF